MKILVFLVFSLPILVFGRGVPSVPEVHPALKHYIKSYCSNESRNTSVKIHDFVKKLERKKADKTNAEFIRLLFTTARAKFLRHYTDHASFEDLTTTGRYNCLTGTALYALLLDHFDIEYEIIETNYHIFLIASIEQGKILLESTDPFNGFVNNPNEIEYRIGLYKQNKVLETKASKQYYRYNFNLYNEVNLDQLAGLLHYNLAVEAFNQQNLGLAIDQLEQALVLYNSPRIAEFSSILLLAVMEGKLDNSFKEICLKKILTIRKKQGPVLASKTP